MSTEHLTGFLQWLDQTLATEALAAIPDHQLLERFLASHDEAAFRALISRHGPMVYRVCRRVLPDEQETEDAFQAAFLVLIRKAGSIRKRMSLASWLHGVAYQVALRLRTSSQRRRVREARVGSRDEVIAADDRSWKEIRGILDEELARLPENLRAPLVLCYLEGLTQDEAAKQLGQTKRTLRRYLERGRELLGILLTQRGLASSGVLMATLISECVEAMPPRLAASAATLGEAIRTGKLGALSQTLTTLTDEVIQTMFPNTLNLKWIAAALIGVGLGSAALGSLFVEGQSPEIPVSRVSEDRISPIRKISEPGAFPIQSPARSEVDDRRTMSPEIIKAWEKAGAVYGHFGTEAFGSTAFKAGQAKNGELPGFQFVLSKKLSDLPAPDVPFGLFWIEDSANIKDLAAFSQLRTLQLASSKVIGLKELAVLDQLHNLSLQGENVTDSDLNELVVLQHLQTLDLIGTQVTGAGIKELAALKQLQMLNLSNTKVSDADVKELAALEQLQALALDFTKLTDVGVKDLATLKQLRRLRLYGVPVSDAGIKALTALKQLQWLELNSAQVTDEGVKELTALKQLQLLYLINTQVTDAALKELSCLTHLQALNLIGTNVTDMGLKQLAGLKFNILVLPKQAKTDLGLKHYLAIIDSPIELNLNGWQIADASLKELATLKQLQQLDLSGTNVTDVGVKELATLGQIQTLYLGRTNVTDVGVKELAKLNQLHTLDLSRTQVTEAGVKELVALKQLRWLRLDNTEVRDAGVKEFAALKELQMLDLSGTNVTDASLKVFATLKQLRSLDLSNTQVTAAGAQELREALPKCDITKE